MKRTAFGSLAMGAALLLGTIIAAGSLISMRGELTAWRLCKYFRGLQDLEASNLPGKLEFKDNVE